MEGYSVAYCALASASHDGTTSLTANGTAVECRRTRMDQVKLRQSAALSEDANRPPATPSTKNGRRQDLLRCACGCVRKFS